MNISTISELKKTLLEAIDSYPSIGIVTHVEPDGDGYYSALALQEIFKIKNRKAEIILEEPVGSKYTFLDNNNHYILFSENIGFDLLIIVDCHEESRIGKCAPLIAKAKKIIAIDHHIESKIIPEAFSFIDTKFASIGEIVFQMFEDEIKIFPHSSQKFISEAIYITILNDTDNFMNSNTSSETFRICSKLMELGLEPGKISKKYLLDKTISEMKFVGEVLSTIEIFNDDEILFMHSTLEMLKRNNLNNGVTGGLTRWIKGIKNLKVAVYFKEIGEKRYQLHLRSKFVNVNIIASKFDGGGHKNASGCKINGSLEDIQKMILKEIREQL